MEKEKRNYHKEAGYKAQKKWALKSDLKQVAINIHQPEYNRLKELADASNLPVSKFILKTLQKEFPEVFND
jgi:hypothetical protein